MAISEQQQMQAAKVAHQVNRVLSAFNGDAPKSDWSALTEEEKHCLYVGINAIIANPALTSRDSHELWMNTQIKMGWTYGPVIDRVNKQHPCLVPFDSLEPQDKLKDDVFLTIVKSFL